MKDFLDFAHQLADRSGEVIAEHFHEHRQTRYKADKSPVTDADSAAEALMRAEIFARFPDHGIIGEEGGKERVEADFVWILDPIDGTASYMAGIPTFGTLIGLLHQGKPILGLMNQPVIGQRWSALKNHAAYYNAIPVKTRDCARIEDALLATTSPTLFTEDGRKRFEAIREKAKYTIYGTDCYGYGMLTAGKIDLVIESGLKPHDILPLVPIIEAAGGIVTDWHGKPLEMAESYDVVAAATAELHAEVTDVLRA